MSRAVTAKHGRSGFPQGSGYSKGHDVKAANVPVSEQWASVRLRIHQIQSAMETIAKELTQQQEETTDEVILRLESLQEKFEKVMGQLAAFDEEGDDSIRKAKEEFGGIIERYRISRKNGRIYIH